MEKQKGNGGIGVCGLLFVLFVGLKLTEVIDWSWWWVTAPLWGGFALVVAIVCGGFALAYVGIFGLTLIQKFQRWRNDKSNS